MNWLDRAIEWVSPETAYERKAYRRALEQERNYDAAGFDRVNSNWRVINESAEMTDRYGRDVVRARARDLERNSDIMGAVIGAYKRNVFGRGYRLRASSGDEKLNTRIEELWEIWCKKKNCDVTGTQSFNAMMRMAVRRKKIDGGIILLKRYTAGGLVPFKLQAIEVDELDTNSMRPHKKGNRVVGGIEYNPYNRPVGYWIKQYSIDGMDITDPTFIEEKEVIFFFTKNRPSQIREMSDMTPTITRIRDANEFMRAVSVKERILSCLAVFITRKLPEAGKSPGRGITAGVSGESNERYQGKTLTPGMIQYLNQGDEAQVVNPSGQATDATAYTKQEIRLVGAGQGLSYETVSRDMSESNYSSARQGMIEDDLTYEEDKEQLMEVMDEIYETFVISLVLSGKIAVPDFWDKKDGYLAHKWIQAPKRWIDPLKEANANKIALNTGQKTWASLAAENGRDWKEQIDEMAEILAYGDSKGIDMGGIIFGKADKQPAAGAGAKETNGNAGKS
ncbi:phage portal protein [Enterocloster lavalensis]|uniref:phage portal protein n=1 Tax=Enterocloster lavalensis TaxID=460384 RepID=UPI002047C71B|nr:phage portal protein [Enterocloster lavalensis]DAE72570.1 MAG TPA: portal protein [Caudoviricetes sp.]